MYDAMEKRRLKILLVRSHAQDALLCYLLLTCCVKDGKLEGAEEF
jgi:hypothetical protein